MPGGTVISALRAGLVARELAHDRRFERAQADPRASQARLLQALVRRNADTAFGREHGFAAVRTPDDFARRVPARDYEGFRPYVDRIAAGEQGVLTADTVTMFTTTSGTTDVPKLIPVTERWAQQTAALMRLWMHRAGRDHPRGFDDRLLLVVSPAIEGRTPTGFAYGAMSGLTSERAPWVARRRYAAPTGLLSLLHDHEDRYLLLMRLALARPISAVATPNPTSLLRLAHVAARRSEDIVRAVRDGTLGIGAGSLPDDGAGRAALASLRASLRPDRRRALALDRQLAEHGSLSPARCWPGLALIGCWLGGSAGVHASRLREHYGTGTALRDLGLLASEGRFTIPVEDETAAGPLAVHASYYEFVPEAEMDAATPTVLGAHELRQGERYAVLLTGGNGLYRYAMNDVVEVRGFAGRTPEVAFVRKGRDVVSITGEKLHLNHVQAAVRTAEGASGLRVWQWRLIPDVERCSYDLLVEVQGPAVPDARATALLRSFDATLCVQNCEYDAKRASGRLGPPQLHVMRAGWSEDSCRRDFRAGRRESQHKWRHFCDRWDGSSRAQVAASFELPWAAAGATMPA